MIEFLKKLFGRAEKSPLSHELYDLVHNTVAGLDLLIEDTLNAVSAEQIRAREEIDALLHEVTLKKQAIASGAQKAEHVQQIRASVMASVSQLTAGQDNADAADAS